MFLKPAISDSENGIKRFKNLSPEKNHIQRKVETRKDTI